MIRPILDETLTILRQVPGDPDRYGNAVLETARVREVPCRIFPVNGREDITNQEQTGQARLQAVLPAGTDVLHTDEVEYRGDRYRISDMPKRFNRRGLEHHVEILIERFTR